MTNGTLWQPEHPAGHAPYCVTPSHPPGEWCAADPVEPDTMKGRPSHAWLLDHPAAMRFVLNESGLAELADRYPVEDDHSALLALETAILGNGVSSPPLITGPCELAIDLLADGGGEIDGYRVIIRPDESEDAPWLASHICRVSYFGMLDEADENGGLYDPAEIVQAAVATANQLLAWRQQ